MSNRISLFFFFSRFQIARRSSVIVRGHFERDAPEKTTTGGDSTAANICSFLCLLSIRRRKGKKGVRKPAGYDDDEEQKQLRKELNRACSSSVVIFHSLPVSFRG